jgi:uncharacterized protein DUF5916/cellulose/xylan binding protein with CBM9 domain
MLALVPVAAIERSTTLDIPRVVGPFVVDAVLDEPGWADALRTTLDYEIRPGENTPPPVETEVLLAEDGDGILIAFIAHDPDPDQIRAYLQDRDSAYQDDHVGVVLDTFNDERRAFQFRVNALGAQMDLINDDVNGSEDDTWDAIWDSAGRITETGYVVEMRIPYRALRFPATGEELIWGIDLIRVYPREYRYQLRAVSRDRDVACYLCQIGEARGMAGAEPGRNIEVTPVLAVGRSESTDDPLNDPLTSDGTDIEPGLDVRWGITPDISLTATLNPDFSQVEADVPQLDVNNQFALFFPEKRSFFLEGQDTFNTPFNIVHTRNIADPGLGLKITGKQDANTFGAFTTDDSITNILIPGSQGSGLTSLDQGSTVFVGRYRRDIGDLNSALGGIVTARQAGDYYNYVAGIDGRWQITESDRLIGQVLASSTQYDAQTAADFGQPTGSFSDIAMRLNFNHSERDWFQYTGYENVGEDFRADMGFLPRVDYDKLVIGGGRRWYPEDTEASFWNRIQISGDWDITHDQSGQLIERESEGSIWMQARMQSFIEIGLLDRITFFNGEYFDEDRVFIFGEFQPVAGLQLAFFARDGASVDFTNARIGQQRVYEPSMTVNAGRHMQWRLSYQINQLNTPAGAQIFDARLTDARFTYQFDIRSFLRLTIQHSDVIRNQAEYINPVDARTRSVSWQLLYSYKVNPQTLVFLGFSQVGFQDDSLPGIEVFGQTAFLKLSYAWIP